MFKAIAADRPYPATGLTTALWREIQPVHVPITDLIATQDHLKIGALSPTHHGSHSGDRLVHVVKWEGRLYLEDGHHRVVRERLAGADWVNARVFDIDRHGVIPPTPAVAEPDPALTEPGLVWVDGRGYRSVHLARALQATGARVDWHRWSPGTSDRERANWQDAS